MLQKLQNGGIKMRFNSPADLPPHLRKQVEQQLGQPKKQSKYNNKRTLAGHMEFSSQHEAERYGELVLMQKADHITALQTQVWFLLVPKNGKNQAMSYIADFTYYDLKQKKFVVEDAKGFLTDVYKMKKKLMYEVYGIEIQEV